MATSERDALLADQADAPRWLDGGDPWIWLYATAVALCMTAVLGVLLLIAWRGFAHFWPADIQQLRLTAKAGSATIIGELVQRERLSLRQFGEATGMTDTTALPQEVERWLLQTGNRRIAPPDFRWVVAHEVQAQSQPEELWVIERAEWGNAYGRLSQLVFAGDVVADPAILGEQFSAAERRARSLREAIARIERGEFAAVSSALEQLRLERRRVELELAANESALAAALMPLEQRRAVLQERSRSLEAELDQQRQALQRDSIRLTLASGQELRIALADIVRAWQPNAMSGITKIRHYLTSIWVFLSEDPREANTEGGVFPAIFGTVLMVLLMALLVTPFGVVAAVYLHEYARQGPFVQLIRIAVNNLAGVPSIVYGVFGLGFFVYVLGGNIDQLFFPESLPAPTFGTPGLLWASLTLAVLTVPVVIVSAEEGLSRIPRSLREGSLALGATKAETLFRVVLPMATPSILTGVILAVARAAGEVAPLMLVGVVKLAPALPVDGNFPYLHLERKFMHLGFHIYDVGFQSPNVEAARPLVFATALLLVLIVLSLNLSAIVLRSRLEIRYRNLDG